MSLDALRAFVAFADHLNFTHAAETLRISQPALYVKIRELSRLLDCTLYLRRGRQLELTLAGIEVARFGRELSDRVDQFCGHFSAADPQRPVVVAAGAGAYRHLLGASLRSYLKTGDAARLSLVTERGESAVAAVEEGRADLAVAVLPEAPTGVSRRLLRRVGHALVVPGKHALSRKKSVGLRDLRDLRLVVPPRTRPHRQTLESHLAAAEVPWTVGAEAEGWDLTLQFVGLGFGCAVVNDFCEAPRGLVMRPLAGLPPILYHVYFRKSYLRPEANRLIQCMLG